MMPTLLSPSQFETVPTLTDRCDGCSAAAKLVIVLTTGGELAFCGHHANRLAGDLTRIAARVSVEEGFEWAGGLGA